MLVVTWILYDGNFYKMGSCLNKHTTHLYVKVVTAILLTQTLSQFCDMALSAHD